MIELKRYESLLDERSLAETLWRLEEVRMGFSQAEEDEVERALDWVASRQGMEGAYPVEGHRLFAPAEEDKDEVELITGERFQSTGGTDHILGEEALRALILWGREEDDAAQRGVKALEAILDLEEDSGTHRDSGLFCCAKCSVAMLKTVSIARTEAYEKTIRNGIQNIKKSRDGEGRWNSYPFYYTLFALSEIKTPEALAELRYAGEKAEGLLGRYEGDDRRSLFRRVALETALDRS